MMPNHPQSIWISGEVLGVRLRPGILPWNSEKIHVEASLRLPHSARVHADFRLEIAGRPPVAALRLQPGADGKHHLHFGVPPLAHPCEASIHWRSHKLQVLTIPITSRADYLASVSLREPLVRMDSLPGGIFGSTFAIKAKTPLSLLGTLAGPWPLLPLYGETISIETRAGEAVSTVEIPLSSNALDRPECPLILPLTGSSRKATQIVMVRIGPRELYRESIHFLTAAHLARTLLLSDMWFQVERDGGTVRSRSFPIGEDVSVSPRFRVRLKQRGAAWAATATIRGVGDTTAWPPFSRPVALSESISEIVGPTMRTAEYRGLYGLELLIADRSVGILTLAQVPQAVLDSEGGFAEDRTFDWNERAEAELQSRLSRLME